MDKLSEKILNKIKEEGIKPTPRWNFLLKDAFFWFVFGLAVILGGLSFSIIFNSFLNNDWDLYLQLQDSFFKFFIFSVPYFWLIIFSFLIFVAYLNLNKTKKAYKYSLPLTFGAVLFLSFFVGLSLYNSGLAFSVEEKLSRTFPQYGHIFHSPMMLWDRPEKGFLYGEVLSTEDERIILEDFEGVLWEVTLSEQAFEIVPLSAFKQNLMLKIIGREIKESCEERCFLAEMIRPFVKHNLWSNEELMDEKMLEEINMNMRKTKPFMQGRMHYNLK